jgi:hypothetical protein
MVERLGSETPNISSFDWGKSSGNSPALGPRRNSVSIEKLKQDRVFPNPPEIIHAWCKASVADGLSFGSVARSSWIKDEHELSCLNPLLARGSFGNDILSLQYSINGKGAGEKGMTPVTNRYTMHPRAHRSTALVYPVSVFKKPITSGAI